MADICDYCYRKPATVACVSTTLMGNECVSKRCRNHPCICARGEKMTIEEYNARKSE